MATTDYPVNSPHAVKHWEKDLMKEALKRTYAFQFMAEGGNSIIDIKTELNKAAGDRITFGLRQQLTGDGVSGDATLEGNEEALVTYSQNVTIDQLRHAVRSKGKMSEQRVPFSVRAEARDGLADWWAARIDTWFFNQIAGNTEQADLRYTGHQATVAPDTDHQVFPGAATAETSLSATTAFRFHLALIDKARERATTAVNQMQPVMVGNKKMFVAFLHPYQVTALRQSTATTQWNDIQQAILQGGMIEENPILTGALGIYNNTILHESTRVPLVTGPAGAGTVARAILCGKQAACIAYGRGHGKNTYNWVEELFDFQNQLGVAAGCISGMVKSRFNGSDFASVVMSTYEVRA